MGFHISINGCGLKTAENLSAAATIPLERLLLETDAPWCSLTSGHASNLYLTTPTITQSRRQKKSASPKGQQPTLSTATPQPQPQENQYPEAESETDPAPLHPSLSALYNPQPRCAPDRFVPGRAVKGRNEPCAIGLVAHVLAQLKRVELSTLTERVWRNTIELFSLETQGKSGAITDGGGEGDDELLATMRAVEGSNRAEGPSPKEFNIEKEEWPSL